MFQASYLRIAGEISVENVVEALEASAVVEADPPPQVVREDNPPNLYRGEDKDRMTGAKAWIMSGRFGDDLWIFLRILSLGEDFRFFGAFVRAGDCVTVCAFVFL